MAVKKEKEKREEINPVVEVEKDNGPKAYEDDPTAEVLK